MDGGDYAEELNVVVRVVHMACSMCVKLQKQLLSPDSDKVKFKHDNSLVTVADWSVQAAVSWMLRENFSGKSISIIAEEDIDALSKPEDSSLLEMVVTAVNECLSEAKRFGLHGPEEALIPSQILEAISQCSSTGGPVGQHWVLDPVDGTLGFVRGDQYAVALSMIDNGEVVLGVLGCPNYPIKGDGLNMIRIRTSDEAGSVMYTSKGSGKVWMQPLVHPEHGFMWPNSAVLVGVSSVDDPALATICEPVERTHSDEHLTADIANRAGLRKKPLRIYSMVKYAAIARGEAEVYMRFAMSGYKEKIWDHAAGVLLVQEAGGVVTDARGSPLDFSKGIFLEGVDRGIIACSGRELHDKLIIAVHACSESSHF